MRTRILVSVILIMACVSLSGQTPQAFKYQAVIRDTSGNVLSDKLISLRISILRGDMNGEEAYREIHDAWTDKLGLVNLNIGQGIEVSRDFSEIPWGEGPFFMRMEIDLDGAMNYQYLGTSQLLSVPYALYAGSSDNDFWEKGENGIHYTQGRLGIGTDDPRNTLDVNGGTTLRANTILGSGNWIGLYFNGYGNDDQPEWLFTSHNDGGCFQFRRWDGVDFSEHYLKVDEGRFRFGAYDSPPLMYHFHGWTQITDSLKVGTDFFIGKDGNVGIGNAKPLARLEINSSSEYYDGRDLLIVHNNSNDSLSLASLKIKAGDNNSFTALQHNAGSYVWEGRSDLGILSNDGNGLILAATNDTGDIRFETGGAGMAKERMRITGNGRVGIATANPESTLDVQGRNIELADFVFLGRMYSGTDLLLGHNIKAIDYENTRGAYVANDWPLGYSGIRMYNGTIQFHAKGGYVYEGELASSELMRIVSNGNVGIGTTDPQRNLHIRDMMRLEPRYSPPEAPSKGDIYMDGNEHVLKVFNGTEWKSCW